MKLDNSWVNKTVSEGTQREESLIRAFEAVLSHAGRHFDRPGAVYRLMNAKGPLLPLDADDLRAVWLYAHVVLAQLLNGVAPDGCFFGPQSAQSSTYGFWNLPEQQPVLEPE